MPDTMKLNVATDKPPIVVRLLLWVVLTSIALAFLGFAYFAFVTMQPFLYHSILVRLIADYLIPTPQRTVRPNPTTRSYTARRIDLRFQIAHVSV